MPKAHDDYNSLASLFLIPSIRDHLFGLYEYCIEEKDRGRILFVLGVLFYLHPEWNNYFQFLNNVSIVKPNISLPKIAHYRDIKELAINETGITAIVQRDSISDYDHILDLLGPTDNDPDEVLLHLKKLNMDKETFIKEVMCVLEAECEDGMSSQCPFQKIKYESAYFLNRPNFESNLKAYWTKIYHNIQLKAFITELECVKTLTRDAPNIQTLEGASVVLNLPRTLFTPDVNVNALTQGIAQMNLANRDNVERGIMIENSNADCPVSSQFVTELNHSIRLHEQSSFIEKKTYGSESFSDRLEKQRQISDKIYECELMPHFSPCSDGQFVTQLVGLWSSFVPIISLPKLLQNGASSGLIDVITRLVVSWTYEQRLERCIQLDGTGKKEYLEREIQEPGYREWSPFEQPEWLFMQLEMDMMFRKTQVSIAKAMMRPDKGIEVTQLNMGEGKTAVIVPMLLSALADGEALLQLTVLRSLLEANYESLVLRLGGLLQRRVFVHRCERKLDYEKRDVTELSSLFQKCAKEKNVVVTLPEFRLSLKLMAYSQAAAHNFETAKAIATLQGWMSENVRDILDESDEILHHKYQLVYAMGGQQNVDGGSQRWSTYQTILNALVLIIGDMDLDDTQVDFGEEDECEVFEYPRIRLLTEEAFPFIAKRIMDHLLNNHVTLFSQENLRPEQQDVITRFCLNQDLDESTRAEISQFDKSMETLLCIRGALAYRVLYYVLSKRYRVEFGVGNVKKIAVPFKAKDLPSERTEFGHVDMMIGLTMLSYYWRGLSEKELCRTLDTIMSMECARNVYSNIISNIPKDILQIRDIQSINLKDPVQFCKLHAILSKATKVVEFYVNTFVFPEECKQFPGKIVSSAWDLAAKTRYPMAGFSGTNDHKMLLPTSVKQHDLDDLKSTNGKVLMNLLLPENNICFELPRTTDASDDIIDKTLVEKVHVLLDAGALIFLSNDMFAAKWLSKADPESIDAVVYFDKNDILRVLDRSGILAKFSTSAYVNRLDRCIVYLDDAHTRGVDLKFPVATRGALTVGARMTKDRLTQAAMRLRLLGKGHKVTFWLSHDVSTSIRNFTKIPREKGHIQSMDLIQYIVRSTCEAIKDGFIYWAQQGIEYHRKSDLIENLQNGKQSGQKISKKAIVKEIVKLGDMYGQVRQKEYLPVAIQNHLNKVQLETKVFNEAFSIVQTCKDYVSSSSRYMNTLNEEQERELEAEVEEQRQYSRPPRRRPAQPSVSEELCKLILTGRCEVAKFIPLFNILQQTTAKDKIWVDEWPKEMYATQDFTRSVEDVKGNLDEFLKLPKWIVSFSNKALVISQYEANELLPAFRASTFPTVRLHMYVSRKNQDVNVLLDQPGLCLPISNPDPHFNSSSPLMISINLFSGACFFKDAQELESVLGFLGLCLRKFDKEESDIFQMGEVNENGFVAASLQARESTKFRGCPLKHDPVPLLRALMELRHIADPLRVTHLGKMLYKKTKPEKF
jgi:uncharacterized membrane protein